MGIDVSIESFFVPYLNILEKDPKEMYL